MSTLLPDDRMFRVLRMDSEFKTGDGSAFPTLAGLTDTDLARVIAANRERAKYLGVKPVAISPSLIGSLAEGCWQFRIKKATYGYVVLKLYLEHTDPDAAYAIFVNERLLHIARGGRVPLVKFKIPAALSPDTRFMVVSATGIVPHATSGDYWAPEHRGGADDIALINAHLEQLGATAEMEKSLYREIGEGMYLSKKGHMNLPGSMNSESKKTLAELSAQLDSALRQGLDLKVFASHGTLLGLIRDGDLIEHDDDFDCAYLSAQTDVRVVSQERFAIVEYLRSRGFDCWVGLRGNLKVYRDVTHIDLMPAWIDRRHLNISSYASIKLSADDLLPFSNIAFHGAGLNVPRNARKLLKLIYGPTWKIPDPLYRSPILSSKQQKILRIFKNDNRERPDLSTLARVQQQSTQASAAMVDM